MWLLNNWEFPKIGDPNIGPRYRTLNSKILILRTPKEGAPNFGNSYLGLILAGRESSKLHASGVAGQNRSWHAWMDVWMNEWVEVDVIIILTNYMMYMFLVVIEHILLCFSAPPPGKRMHSSVPRKLAPLFFSQPHN